MAPKWAKSTFAGTLISGLIRDRGHAWTGIPIRKYDYAPLFRRVEDFGATDVGFNVYSGNHRQMFAAVVKQLLLLGTPDQMTCKRPRLNAPDSLWRITFSKFWYSPGIFV